MPEPVTALYRQHPVRAVQWTGDNADEVHALAACDFQPVDPADPWDDDPEATAAVRDDLRGGTWRPMRTGDWVVFDSAGRLYPVSAVVFAETYGPVTMAGAPPTGLPADTPPAPGHGGGARIADGSGGPLPPVPDDAYPPDAQPLDCGFLSLPADIQAEAERESRGR